MRKKLPETDAQIATDDWLQRKWRPVMAFLYVAICACDFIIFPIFWTIIHTTLHTGNYSEWQPLTLQGGGLIHLSFGAILGVAAWGRTQEKLASMTAYPYMQNLPVEETTVTQENIPVVRPMR